IRGAVNQPGKFFFVDGDNIQDALLFARGINKAYEGTLEIAIHRQDYDGKEVETIIVDQNSNQELMRGDQIIVKANETQRKEFNVLVIGEVNSPGYIPITKGRTTLGEVMKKVGGFTEEASLNRARLFRGNSINLLLERQYGVSVLEDISLIDTSLLSRIIDYEEMLMLRMSNLVEEDLPYFQIENYIKVINEGSITDFSKIED